MILDRDVFNNILLFVILDRDVFNNMLLFVYTYFRAYIHSRFKHAVLGTHSAMWAVCLGQLVGTVWC